MLIEFSVSNWRSINSQQTISFVKTSGNELAESNCHQHVAYKIPLLKSIAIFGPNAGGKSNFLKAIKKVKDTVLSSADGQHGDSVGAGGDPFLLDNSEPSKPTEFELAFIADGVRYQYGFAATVDLITEEWLFAFPKQVAQKWFTRTWNQETESYDWTNASSFKSSSKQMKTWQDSTRKNALFLSTAVQLNCTQLQPVFDWFKKTLVVNLKSGFGYEQTAKMHIEDALHSEVMGFIKAADLSIYDLFIESEKFNPESIPEHIPVEIKEMMIRDLSGQDFFEIRTIHKKNDGNLQSFDLREESEGTKKIFAIAGPLLSALKNGKVFVIDELNDKLHPKLVNYLIQLFNSKEFNPKGAQLLFATHETSILDQNLMRRDQIWFSEKAKDQSSHLTQLTEYKVIKGRENIESYYSAGVYSAIPRIGNFKITFKES